MECPECSADNLSGMQGLFVHVTHSQDTHSDALYERLCEWKSETTTLRDDDVRHDGWADAEFNEQYRGESDWNNPEAISDSLKALAQNGEHPMQQPDVIARKVANTDYDNHPVPTGEDHHNWNGAPNYPREFYHKRSEIRERDNYICQLCWISQSVWPEALSVHHVDEDRENIDDGNLLTVCKFCHLRVFHSE